SFRQRSIRSVLQELSALRELYGVDYVRICDDVFGIQRRWTEEFLDALIARRWGLRFECLSRADLLRPELLPRLKEAGLRRVFLGVESGSQAMLDLMNRGITLSQVERASAALRAHGIDQYWFLMLGYPGETLGDLDATVRLFRRFAPEEYSVSVAVPLPGTRFEKLVDEGAGGRGR
ncbi:radical SAM domain-containing protein, partial [mine drainage metagenome]